MMEIGKWSLGIDEEFELSKQVGTNFSRRFHWEIKEGARQDAHNDDDR